MAEPLFSSREEFDLKAQAAGLAIENCAYVAANALVTPFLGGIDISSEPDVRRAFREKNFSPKKVEVDRAGRIENWSARIGCRACDMSVVVIGGYSDMQQVALPKDSVRQCPIFNEKNPRRSDDEYFAEDFIKTGERLGYYSECFGYEDPTDGSKKYYALVMPKNQYDKLLQETNDRLKENADLHRQSFFPWACLPWEIQIEQPTFVQGYASRKEALLASMQALRSLNKK